ncbi:MAG: insulinase family protein [Gemmatimonadota bacterium]|nr:MAG: insulinase family protein [Gemmatimonadota bacterium]
MSGRTSVDRSLRPAAGPSPKIVLPAFKRLRLANGLSVLSVRHDDMPEVSARLVLPYGACEDAREHAGTALLVARALTEGTTERSAPEVAEWLDYLGARFSLDINHDTTLLSLHFLSQVMDGAFDLLAEVLARPAFDEGEVGRLRDERLDEIASGLDEPRIVANLRMGEASFGSHPYGMRAGGIEETVRQIDAGVLSDFHSRFYRPSGATLILVGDVPEPDELQGRLESAFGSWQGDFAAATVLADPEPIGQRRLWAVPWPGPQSEIRVGGIGIARLDPDYYAALIMNAILGGLFSSRINMNLREDKGWTYGASSRFDARKRRGPFFVATAVEAKATVDAVREIIGEMERMTAEQPQDEEMELAVNAVTLSLPRLFETVDQVSGRIAGQVVFGLPDDYWETYADQIRAVTASDVQNVAQRFLASESFAVVVVGPVHDFRSDLESLGPVQMRDIHGRPTEL